MSADRNANKKYALGYTGTEIKQEDAHTENQPNHTHRREKTKKFNISQQHFFSPVKEGKLS